MLGKAYIVDDPEEINNLVHDDIRELAANHLVLIKVRMSKADYFETPDPARHAGWWRDLLDQLHSWMFNTRRGYRPYHLSDTSMSMFSYRPVA
ncbi:hypothetical protein ACQ86N_31655 [Puia sp. P3]|uniref:hypothetical protein n=1 Tax=Puia sp. P3 TaxID=3423952 RepID=UPI003D66D3B9